MKRNTFPPVLAAVLAAAILPATAAPLPRADPSVFADYPPGQLLELSFLGVNRANIRTYLAEHRPDTIEGKFCRGWVLGDRGKHGEAAAAYTKLIEDSGAKGRVLAIAAGNRNAQAVAGNLEEESEYRLEAIRIALGEGSLNSASNLGVQEATRKTWLAMFQRHPGLLGEQRAAYLVCEGRYQFYERKDYGKVREIATELRAMDLDEWKGDFNFPFFLNIITSSKVFPDMKASDRLLGGGLAQKLLAYQAQVARGERDPVRRATVAGWCNEYAKRVFDLDKRFDSLSLLSFRFMDPEGGGSLALFPNGTGAGHLGELWNRPRNGIQFAEQRSRDQEHDLEDLVRMLNRDPAVPDAESYTQRGILLAQSGRLADAERSFAQAARCSFHPDSRIDVIVAHADHVLGPARHDLSSAARELEALLGAVTPDGRRQACSWLARLAFASGDMAKARGWIGEFRKCQSASGTWANERLDSIESIEKLLAAKDRYLASNPLEAKWKARHGRQGISAQLKFATNSDELPANTATALAPILRVLKDETYRNLMFRVEGHTDSSGSDAINEPLSMRRARSVAGFLEGTHGVARSRIEVDGFGARRPIASNLSESGRAINRRAELNLMGDASRPQLVATGTLADGITAVSPDGRLMLSTNGDVWDTTRWVRLYSVPLRWSWQGVTFSPDGRYLFVAQNDKAFSIGVLIDARTGVVADLVPNPSTGGMAVPVWSPDSRRIAFMTGTPCHVYNVVEKRFEGTAMVPGSKLQRIYPAWIRGGRGLAMGCTSGATLIYVADTDDYEVDAIPVPAIGYMHGMASSHDARYLYVSDDSGVVIDWDTLGTGAPGVREFWKQAQAKGIRFTTRSIAVHPGNPRLLALPGMHTEQWGIVDFVTGKIGVDKAPSAPRVFWGADGKELLVSGGWVANEAAGRAGAGSESGIYRLDLRRGRGVGNDNLEFVKGLSARLWSVKAYEDEEVIVAASAVDVSVWDVKTGRQIHSWPGGMDMLATAPQGEPGVFYGIEEGAETVLYRYDLREFRRTKLAELGFFDVSGLDAAGEVVVVGGHPFSGAGKGTEEVTLKVVHASEGGILKERNVPSATARLRYGKLTSSGFESIALSPSGGTVAFVTEWGDGYGYGTTTSKQVGLWNWKQDRLGDPIENTSSTAIEEVLFEDEGKLRISRSKYWDDAVHDVGTGKFLQSRPQASRPERGNSTDLEEAFVDLNLRVEFTTRGEIRFLRRDRNEVVVTVLKKGAEWIAYNADGYFAASAEGTGKVFWRVGTRMLPLEALRDKYENPALLAESMKAIFEKRVVKKEDDRPPAIDPDLFSIPYEVKVTSSSGGETRSGSYTMKVEVTTLVPDAPEPVFVWTVNGHTGRGFKVVPAKVEPQRYTAEHEFQLGEGTNVLSVALRYKNAVVMPQTVTVRRTVPKAAPGNVAARTHLWFFGVGVKDYERPSQNLEYADRDVLELEKVFKAQEGKLFREVHTKVLTNADAKVRNIKVEMNRFLKQASSEDLIVVFLAGHGIVDTDQELYFVAHDSDISEPYTGLELRDFADFLERRPPNQKALFLMDICHAGSFGQTSRRRGSGLTADDAVKLVAQGTGTVVLASSTGRESSLEDASWRGGHGAFTAALLDGLEGKADSAAGNGDGYVFLTELTSFVSREVPRLTNGGQHPTTPRMENFRDFPLGKRR